MEIGSKKKLAGASEHEVKSDINVTPLVDVCLVLLIIFMVVTPLLTSGADVTPPKTANPESMPETPRDLKVAITQTGVVYIDYKPVAKADVLNTLKTIYQLNPEKKVVIKGDGRLKYREIRELLRLINQAGFPGAGMITEKEAGKG